MKKNNFLEGAVIATIGVIISRVIGLIYVIPFVSMIGIQGGALYSYGYSIYAIFLSLSSSGIPVAMSKIVSEYNTLGYYHTKERAYKIGTMIMATITITLFILIWIFAKELAYAMIGDATVGNTIEDITQVIKAIATAILIVPFLSVTKGYLEGQKYMTPSSISNVIEQIVRVLVLLIGTYVTLKVLHLPMKDAISIAVFGATVGATVAFLYLMHKIRKNKKLLNRNHEMLEEEKLITDKEIAMKVIKYAIPFIIINLTIALISSVDTFTIVKTLSNLNYPTLDIETAFGVITNWGTKINTIVISISIGVTASLIPNLTSGLIKNNYSDISRKINQTIQVMLYLTLPMSIGLFLIVEPIWVLFYGYNELSIDIYRMYTIIPVTFSLSTILINSMQTLNKSKVALGLLLTWFVGKAFLTSPMMNLLDSIGLDAYYGSLIVSVIMQSIVIITILYVLKKEYQVKYDMAIKNSLKILSSVAVMIIVILLVSLIFPIGTTNRLDATFQVVLYTIVGGISYFYTTYKLKLMHEVFGETFINNILNKFKRKID